MAQDRTRLAPAPLVVHDPSRRWLVFVHQDGVILSLTLRALAAVGILERSLAGEERLSELFAATSPSGFGYLRVGLRCLASQGWLSDAPTLSPDTTQLKWTDAGRDAMAHREHYLAVGEFMSSFSEADGDAWSRPWTRDQAEGLLALVPPAVNRWNLDEDLPPDQRALITTHLDAGVLVPVMLSLLSAGRTNERGAVLGPGELDAAFGLVLGAVGWLEAGGGGWTLKGRQAVELAVHLGMTASYLPLLSHLPDLYRGTTRVPSPPGASEWHVNRALNVRASAAAHRRYFADADRIFIELFDRRPLEAQPRFIADMGCGDGSWLVHLYELISQQTLRGNQLEQHPLLMVGLDWNPAALEEARRVLSGAQVPFLVLAGEVSDPDSTRMTLADHGLRIEDGLHIHAFIDHDRAYRGGGTGLQVSGFSSGAYVGSAGAPLGAAEVERDFVAHLRRWKPHVRKHGLVVLEAHCVAPLVARRHLGATHSVAFDAYHGYSHQYPIEHAAFLRGCSEAGFRPACHCERRYPASRPFVAVSLNRLVVAGRSPRLPDDDGTGARIDSWTPGPDVDLEDGQALHELLYIGGDLRYPRQWCSAATGIVVAGALEIVEERLKDVRPGEAIRVLDYGAGTGLAAIELLKACAEVGIEERLEESGARLELHLVDLPSSWFAQAFALLRGCGWTAFHSLRSPERRFRPLLEVTGGRRMDAVMANMVFHLIPAQALDRAAAELASVTKPGGGLVWNAPDLAPAGEFAVLFHDANRELRRRWLAHVAARRRSPSTTVHWSAQQATACAIELLDVGELAAAQKRAAQRVLPEPNTAGAVASALRRHYGSPGSIDRPTHEILCEDLLDTLLVPSNQREFLSEISDEKLRVQTIRELMLGEVLPALQAGAAGTAIGLNVQWTLGRVTRANF